MDAYTRFSENSSSAILDGNRTNIVDGYYSMARPAASASRAYAELWSAPQNDP
jgi:hypothetical protein